jgi:hypothetical protein
VDAGPHPIVWSNYGGWNMAETAWDAQYVIKERLNTNSSHYIKAFVYGIIAASTVLNFTQTVTVPVITYFNTTDSTNETLYSNQTFDVANITNGNDTLSPRFNITFGKNVYAYLNIVKVKQNVKYLHVHLCVFDMPRTLSKILFIAESKAIEIIQNYSCPKASKSKPATSAFECKKNFSLENGQEAFNFSTGDTYALL